MEFPKARAYGYKPDYVPDDGFTAIFGQFVSIIVVMEPGGRDLKGL
jgi:hypothetical protein